MAADVFLDLSMAADVFLAAHRLHRLSLDQRHGSSLPTGTSLACRVHVRVVAGAVLPGVAWAQVVARGVVGRVAHLRGGVVPLLLLSMVSCHVAVVLVVALPGVGSTWVGLLRTGELS